MPELRKDPIINRWVIIASERAKRPVPTHSPREKKAIGFCPLCPGHEEKTAEQVYTDWAPNSDAQSKDWRLRVVLNKFPALVRAGDVEPRSDGLYEKMDGVGAHEVVVETPDHYASIADFDDRQAFSLVDAYSKRILALRQDPRFRYILIFKNHGAEAGASLDHPHSQIITLPIVPKRVLEEMEGVKANFKKRQQCIFCEIIANERSLGSRIVLENSDFIALEPFAARFPYETWILPKQHESRFEIMTDEQKQQLALLLRDTLFRVKNLLDDPPYNFMLHTSPYNETNEDMHYHWHLEITPKLTRVAGFEWGTGFYINPMPPETAAELLRGELAIPDPSNI